jgi:hypothetical protein
MVRLLPIVAGCLIVDAHLVPDLLARRREAQAFVLHLLELFISDRLLGEELGRIHLILHEAGRRGGPVALHMLPRGPEKGVVDGGCQGEAEHDSGEDVVHLMVLVAPAPEDQGQSRDKEEDLVADAERLVLGRDGLVEGYPGLLRTTLPLRHGHQAVIVGLPLLQTEDRCCNGAEHFV